jgi:lipid II:glycine glycyltransferase (peptidoglycan interpeptide bridge formation enzyme)
VVSTFLRLHPLLGNASLLAGSDDLVDAGVTFAWDVGPDRPLMSGMHPHHRRAARRAEREGLIVTVAERPAGLEEFRELYATTMLRQQAEPFYFFPDAYWEALCADRDPLGLVLVEGRLAGQLVAALLCFRNGPWLHYHLGASAEAGRHIGASNRCFLEAAEWAQAAGVTRFHLGGGVGGGPDSSLAVFKSRFAPAAEPLPFHVAKFVHDPDRYVALAGTGSTEGFFPPWRRGLSA